MRVSDSWHKRNSNTAYGRDKRFMCQRCLHKLCVSGAYTICNYWLYIIGDSEVFVVDKKAWRAFTKCLSVTSRRGSGSAARRRLISSCCMLLCSNVASRRAHINCDVFFSSSMGEFSPRTISSLSGVVLSLSGARPIGMPSSSVVSKVSRWCGGGLSGRWPGGSDVQGTEKSLWSVWSTLTWICYCMSTERLPVKVGQQENTSGISLGFGRLFECNGPSLPWFGRFNGMGTSRSLCRLAKKLARDLLWVSWVYGLRAAHRELEGRCDELDIARNKNRLYFQGSMWIWMMVEAIGHRCNEMNESIEFVVVIQITTMDDNICNSTQFLPKRR
jgi:hypothetical protein